jgi:hypothetical protein
MLGTTETVTFKRTFPLNTPDPIIISVIPINALGTFFAWHIFCCNESHCFIDYNQILCLLFSILFIVLQFSAPDDTEFATVIAKICCLLHFSGK